MIRQELLSHGARTWLTAQCQMQILLCLLVELVLEQCLDIYLGTYESEYTQCLPP